MAKTLVGVVSSDKGDKTIIVTVASPKTHPIYKKKFTVNKRFMAHDEQNDAHVGDRVVIAETRPLSARKRFILEKVVERAGIQHVEPEVVPEATTGKEEPKPTVAKKAAKTVKAKES